MLARMRVSVKCFMWQEKNAAAERQQNMRYRIYSASSLTDSLRSVVRLRRAVPAYGRGGESMPGNGSYMIHRFRGEAAEEHVRRKKGPERGSRRCRFSIGSAPLTSITKSDAQISGGETRQDYKDTRRFPLMAPSCALLFLPFGLPVSFRCYGRVYLIPRLTLSSG